MQKFTFTAKEVDDHSSDAKDWGNFVRQREAEIAFSVLSESRFGLALELGAGDGRQSTTIAKYCDRLVCTELGDDAGGWKGKTILDRVLPNVDYRLCDAQDLSQFGDQTFDLVCSSNMLEHIPDIDRCLRECRRVLKDDGVMWHTMPSRWWKAFNFTLSFRRRRWPRIHGVSSSQWQEFRVFGCKVWQRRFERNDFRIERVVGMPFYVGHGNRFIPIIKAGNAAHLPATYLYVVRKANS